MPHLKEIDLALAKDCARSFQDTAQVGCVISDAAGTVLEEYGYGSQRCSLCQALHGHKNACAQSHSYGMGESERFGGKYVYYCPQGLGFFVSPILGEVFSAARITVGPFFMVERQDYLDCELDNYATLPPETQQLVDKALSQVPVFSPGRVEKMSRLLSMAVGFMNNQSQANRMDRARKSGALQGQISNYIIQFKAEEAPPYPFHTETALVGSIRKNDQAQAQQHLNELLGYILFSSGGQFASIKRHISQLLVVMGRAAIDAGCDMQWVLSQSDAGLKDIHRFHDVDSLCLWLSQQLTTLLGGMFQYQEARHSNIIHNCVQFIELHYFEEITLERLAKRVFISPTYLSKVFHKEMGEPFSNYLNRVRIEKSKALLQQKGLRLIDIAMAVGFQDQSYFTKVFKQHVGTTPNKYRDKLPRPN